MLRKNTYRPGCKRKSSLTSSWCRNRKTPRSHSLVVICKIDRNGSADRVSIDDDVSRLDLSLRHQVFPCPLRVLVEEVLPRWSTRAATVSAVVDDEHIQPGVQ